MDAPEGAGGKGERRRRRRRRERTATKDRGKSEPKALFAACAFLGGRWPERPSPRPSRKAPPSHRVVLRRPGGRSLTPGTSAFVGECNRPARTNGAFSRSG